MPETKSDAENPKQKAAAQAEKEPDKYRFDPEAQPVASEHSMTIAGKKLSYAAECGYIPIRDALGEPKAGVFYMAYTVPSEKPRPLTFSFNGGPGSSSVWLHLGAVGPKRAQLQEEGFMPSPPFELVDNEETWLRHTDLVFIDPVGTGYSRSVKKEDETKYWGLQQDIECVGEFIRAYLVRSQRWLSPLFIVGESYGTTRAAGLSDHLVKSGIALNGILLVSSILNFQTGRFNKGNDLPFQLFLPTYAATAWFHKRIASRLQNRSLREVLEEVEKFAAGDYCAALAEGDSLGGERKRRMAKRVAEYTGLSEKYVELSDLRINIHRFCKELLRDERRTVGRFDSRFKGIDGSAVSEVPEHDPSGTALLPPFTACINFYLRSVLGFESQLPYYISAPGELWKAWDFGNSGQGHPDTSEAMRSALSRNPYMRVFVASGYYDLATPYFATRFTLDHLGLDPTLRDQISLGYYEAGHMMYVRREELRRLREDISGFIER